MKPETEPKKKPLPILEISTFTLPIPLAEAMKQLGYEDPAELRRLREMEIPDYLGEDAPDDLLDDPRVKKVLAEYFLEELEKQSET
jgi:hypothetical protein